MTTIEETAAGITRKRCRNLRCRMKLAAPVDNPHKAFCTRGCFEGFYRNRCRVCEADLRKTGKAGDAGRRYCRPPNKCRQEAAQWPQKYEYGLRDVPATTPPRNPHEMGLKNGLQSRAAPSLPSHRALRSWTWYSDDLERELRDADGTLLARLESNAGCHRL